MKAHFDWQNGLIVITTMMTATMTCITIKDNKVKFALPKFVHEVLPAFVTGMLNCVIFDEEN